MSSISQPGGTTPFYWRDHSPKEPDLFDNPGSAEEIPLDRDKLGLLDNLDTVKPLCAFMTKERFAQESAATLLGNTNLQVASDSDSFSWFADSLGSVARLAKLLGMDCGMRGLTKIRSADTLYSERDPGKTLFLLDSPHLSPESIRSHITRLQPGAGSFLILKYVNEANTATNLIIQKRKGEGEESSLVMNLVSAGDALNFHRSEELKTAADEEKGKLMHELACTFVELDESKVNTEGFWKDLMQKENRTPERAYAFATHFLGTYGKRVDVGSSEAAQEVSELFTSRQPRASGQQVMFTTARFIILSLAENLAEGNKNYKHYQMTYKLRSCILMAREYLKQKQFDPSQHALLTKSLTLLNERVDKGLQDELVSEKSAKLLKSNIVYIEKKLSELKSEYTGPERATWSEKTTYLGSKFGRKFTAEDLKDPVPAGPSSVKSESRFCPWEQIQASTLVGKIEEIIKPMEGNGWMYINVTEECVDHILWEMPTLQALSPSLTNLSLEERKALIAALVKLHGLILENQCCIEFSSKEERLHARQQLLASTKIEYFINAVMAGEEELERERKYAAAYAYSPRDYMGLFPDTLSAKEKEVFRELEGYYQKHIEPGQVDTLHGREDFALIPGEDFVPKDWTIQLLKRELIDGEVRINAEDFLLTEKGIKKLGLNRDWLGPSPTLKDATNLINKGICDGGAHVEGDFSDALDFRLCFLRKKVAFTKLFLRKWPIEGLSQLLIGLRVVMCQGLSKGIKKDDYLLGLSGAKKAIPFKFTAGVGSGHSIYLEAPLIDSRSIDQLNVREKPKTPSELLEFLECIHAFLQKTGNDPDHLPIQQAYLVLHHLRRLPLPQDPLWKSLSREHFEKASKLIPEVAELLGKTVSNAEKRTSKGFYNTLGSPKSPSAPQKASVLAELELSVDLARKYLSFAYFELLKESDTDYRGYTIPLSTIENAPYRCQAWSREDAHLYLNLMDYLRDQQQQIGDSKFSESILDAEDAFVGLSTGPKSYKSWLNPSKVKNFKRLTEILGDERFCKHLEAPSETAEIYHFHHEQENVPISAKKHLELAETAGAYGALVGLERLITSCVSDFSSLKVEDIDRLSKVLINSPYLGEQLEAQPQLIREYSAQLAQIRSRLKFKAQYQLALSLLHLEARLLICEAGIDKARQEEAANKVRVLIQEAQDMVQNYEFPVELKAGPLYTMILLSELPTDLWSDQDKLDFAVCFRAHAYFVGEQGFDFPFKLDARLTALYHLFCKESFVPREDNAQELGKALERALRGSFVGAENWRFAEGGQCLFADTSRGRLCWDFDSYLLTVDGQELEESPLEAFEKMQGFIAQAEELGLLPDSVQKQWEGCTVKGYAGKTYHIRSEKLKSTSRETVYHVETDFKGVPYSLDTNSPLACRALDWVAGAMGVDRQELAFMAPISRKGDCHILHRGKPILSLLDREGWYSLQNIVRFSEPHLYLREHSQVRGGYFPQKGLSDLLKQLGPQASVWADEKNLLKRIEAPHLKLTFDVETSKNGEEQRFVVRGSGGFAIAPDQNLFLKQGFIPGGILLRNERGDKKLLVLAPDLKNLPEVKDFKEGLSAAEDPFVIKKASGERLTPIAHSLIEIQEIHGVHTLVPQSYSDCLFLCVHFARKKKYQQLRFYIDRLHLVSAPSERDKESLALLFQTLIDQQTPESRALALAIFVHSQEAECMLPGQTPILNKEQASVVFRDYLNYRKPHFELDLTVAEKGVIACSLEAAKEVKGTKVIAEIQPASDVEIRQGFPFSNHEIMGGEREDSFYKKTAEESIENLKSLGEKPLRVIETLSTKQISDYIERRPHYVWALAFASFAHPEWREKLQVACLRCRSGSSPMSEKLRMAFECLDRLTRCEQEKGFQLVTESWKRLFSAYKKNYTLKRAKYQQFMGGAVSEVQREENLLKNEKTVRLKELRDQLMCFSHPQRKQADDFVDEVLDLKKELQAQLNEKMGRAEEAITAVFEQEACGPAENYLRTLSDIWNKNAHQMPEEKARETALKEIKEIYERYLNLDLVFTSEDQEILSEVSRQIQNPPDSLYSPGESSFIHQAKTGVFLLKAGKFILDYMTLIQNNLVTGQEEGSAFISDLLQVTDQPFSHPKTRVSQGQVGSRRKKRLPPLEKTSMRGVYKPLKTVKKRSAFSEKIVGHREEKAAFAQSSLGRTVKSGLLREQDLAGYLLESKSSVERKFVRQPTREVIRQAKEKQAELIEQQKKLLKALEKYTDRTSQGILEKKKYKVTVSRLIHAWRHQSLTRYQSMLYLNPEQIQKVDAIIGEYLLLKTQAGDWERLIKGLETLPKGAPETFRESLIDQFLSRPHYKASRDTAIDRLFLNMEALGSIRLRKKQVDFIRDFWSFCVTGKLSAQDIQDLSRVVGQGESSDRKQPLSSPVKNLLAQLGTGSGKTKVLAPLMQEVLIMLKEKGELPDTLTAAIYPKNLFDINAEESTRLLYEVFGHSSRVFHLMREDMEPNDLSKLSNLPSKLDLILWEVEVAIQDGRTFQLHPLLVNTLRLNHIIFLNARSKAVEGSEREALLNACIEKITRLRGHLAVGHCTNDECHVTQDPISANLQFAVGERIKLDPEWSHLIAALFDRLVNPSLSTHSLEIAQNHQKKKQEEWARRGEKSYAGTILPDLAEAASQYLVEKLSIRDDEEIDKIKEYLKDPAQKALPIEVKNPDYEELIYLARLMIHKVLPSALNREVNLNYGFIKDEKLKRINPYEVLATPYRGADDPSLGSEFTTLFTVAASYITLIYEGLTFEQEAQLARSLIQQIDSEENLYTREGQGNPSWKRVLDCFGPDITYSQLRNLANGQAYIYTRTEKQKETSAIAYLKAFGPAQFKYFNEKCSSSAQTHSGQLGQEFYYSATTGNQDKYGAKGTIQSRLSDDQKSAESLLRSKASAEKDLVSESFSSPQEAMGIFIERLMNTPKACMLVDSGALMKGIDPQEFARSFLECLKSERMEGGMRRSEIQAVEFFKGSQTYILTLDDLDNPVPSTQLKLSNSQVVRYCDQGHLFGADFVLPLDAKGIVTVSLSTGIYELLQAVGRLRGLKEGQTLQLVIEQERADKDELREASQPIDALIKSSQIIEDLYQEYQVFLSFCQRLDYILEKAIDTKLVPQEGGEVSVEEQLRIFKGTQSFLITPNLPDLALEGGGSMLAQNYAEKFNQAYQKAKKHLETFRNKKVVNPEEFSYIDRALSSVQKDFDETTIGHKKAEIPEAEISIEKVKQKETEKEQQQESFKELIQAPICKDLIEDKKPSYHIFMDAFLPHQKADLSSDALKQKNYLGVGVTLGDEVVEFRTLIGKYFASWVSKPAQALFDLETEFNPHLKLCQFVQLAWGIVKFVTPLLIFSYYTMKASQPLIAMVKNNKFSLETINGAVKLYGYITFATSICCALIVTLEVRVRRPKIQRSSPSQPQISLENSQMIQDMITSLGKQEGEKQGFEKNRKALGQLYNDVVHTFFHPKGSNLHSHVSENLWRKEQPKNPEGKSLSQEEHLYTGAFAQIQPKYDAMLVMYEGDRIDTFLGPGGDLRVWSQQMDEDRRYNKGKELNRERRAEIRYINSGRSVPCVQQAKTQNSEEIEDAIEWERIKWKLFNGSFDLSPEESKLFNNQLDELLPKQQKNVGLFLDQLSKLRPESSFQDFEKSFFR